MSDKFFNLLDSRSFVFLDGGLGTMIQSAGIETGHTPELLNITNPEAIMNIHRQYVESGSDIFCANTFGANSYKLKNSGYTVAEVVSAGIANAKKAAAGRALVALDIGPVGQLLEPSGTLTFEEAYERGAVSHTAKQIYDIVSEGYVALHEIKALGGFGKEDKSQFDRTMVELQMGMFITMTGR